MRAFLLFLVLATPAAALPSWDWQLTEPYDFSRKTDTIATDPDGIAPGDLDRSGAALKICYVSVGTLENDRSDMTAFPSYVLGNVYVGWPDERFLDIRQLDVLLPIMRARFARCRDLGFTAIEPDNIDLHINETGFPIAPTDVVNYVLALRGIARDLDLLIGQKNAPDLSPMLARHLDFAMTENCITDGWCDRMIDYSMNGKPIFGAEYDVPRDAFATFCAAAKDYGISLIFKDRDVRAGGASCQ